MPRMKRTIKDSVFTYLFKDTKYILQLYKSLHREDDATEEKDIELLTLTNVLVDDLYNDLGFLVKGRLIVLVEAQSTFSVNLSLRMLYYITATLQDYGNEKDWNTFAKKGINVPDAVFYIIYSGEERVPDTLRLSGLGVGKTRMEVEVRVLRGDIADKNDIVWQYVRFCKIADEERRKSGPTVETVKVIIDRCIEENVLADFLESRRKEVEDIMVVLYDEKKLQGLYVKSVREEGRAEGRAEEREKGISAMVETLKKFAGEKRVVAQELVENFKLSPEVAAAKVEQYWN